MRISPFVQGYIPTKKNEPYFGVRTQGLTGDEAAYVNQGKPAPDGFVSFVLTTVGTGKPGLSVDKRRIARQDHAWVVYRNPNGQPMCAALLQAERGRWQVTSLAADRTQGLIVGRAVKAVIEELERMGVTEDSITTAISPEARLMLVRMKQRRAKEPATSRLIIARA